MVLRNTKKNLKYHGNEHWVLWVHLFCRWTCWNILTTSLLVIMLPKGGWSTCLLQWLKRWAFMGSAMSLQIWSNTSQPCSLWQYLPPRGLPSLQATCSWKQASNSEGKDSYPFWDPRWYQEDTCLKTASLAALLFLRVIVYLPPRALLSKCPSSLHSSLNFSNLDSLEIFLHRSLSSQFI